MSSSGVSSSKRTTASTAARAAMTRARSRSETMGRVGPLRRHTEASALRPEYEFGTEATAVFEQGDVADVEEVEAAVGEDDGLAGGAPLGYA